MLFCEANAQYNTEIITAAQQTELYLPLLKNKRVALVVNPTSTIGATHLVDSLMALHINIVKVFAPEHGYKGIADAGEHLSNDRDKKQNLEIISLYGNHKKPTSADVENIDIIVFDIQDVGARFYTYISTLHYIMQAAAENKKQLIILDRPNPNGHYVDGSVLEKKYCSFVGMHQIPIVHGMTIGEYAKMINGENWLSTSKQKLTCILTVIKCKNYTHHSFYKLPIKPSPNLPNMTSIYLYPSICFFEGTCISLGRGTDKPFQQYGSPDFKNYTYQFMPKSVEGAKNPPCLNQICFGKNLSTLPIDSLQKNDGINLNYLIEAYHNYPAKEKFFTPFFTSLAGNEKLKQQIQSGLSASEIKKTWQPDLKKFKLIRNKYLLYEQ
ncbi:MAG: hypothetical protein RL708_1057 [Bacteroidota bacterium]|jgi:uncharacterized protein YbbC (DUF1343 family)